MKLPENLKRHYIAGLCLLVFAGLSLYEGFHDGEMGHPIWMGIVSMILGVAAFFYGTSRTWLRPVVIMTPVVLLVLTAYSDFIIGDIGYVIVAVVVLIGHDKPFVEEEVTPWMRPIPIIALCVLIVWKLYSVVG